MSYVRVVTQSVLITFTFFLCWFWNMLFRMIIANHSAFPAWLVPLQVRSASLFISSSTALQIFWLGALGFSNSIIWLPFIRLAIRRVHCPLPPPLTLFLRLRRS
jgi:hypothetical protein